MLLLAAEGTHLIRTVRRKRKAQALRAQAMAIHACQSDDTNTTVGQEHKNSDQGLDRYTEHHV